MARKPKIGFIPANRGFFSKELAARMRAATIETLKAAGADVVVPSAKDTQVGCVKDLAEAQKVGRMFYDARVEGVVIGAVNFGDESSVALTLKEAGRKTPILIFGCQEEEALTPTTPRRDSFCGLLSIGEVLRQSGLAYSVPETPICYPWDESFKQTVGRFLGVVRVVSGIRSARYGQIGARPNDFWTCRFNEKALQQLGVTVVTLDLSEVMGSLAGMKTDAAVKRVASDIAATIDCSAVAGDILERIAKFEIFCKKFIADQQLTGLGIQCWTSMQANLGLCTCGVMGRFDDKGVPAACESDILGTLSMHALQLASGGQPSCLADWNNLHNDDAELVNCWHCGVFPPSWAKDKPRMACQEIIAGTVGRDKAMGVVEFVMKEGPVTLCRATQDNAGGFKVALAEGNVEDNPAKTFGAYGWVRIPRLDRLYKNVLLRHFPHHVAMNRSTVGNILWEAFGNYLGFQTYTAENDRGCWSPDLPF